jgi:hypothetical protein
LREFAVSRQASQGSLLIGTSQGGVGEGNLFTSSEILHVKKFAL